MSPHTPSGYLPRLDRENYCGRAIVFWTHTIENRGTGWLTPRFHQRFREICLHACIREQLFCPVYTLMPDHGHLIWMGIAAESDQQIASTFLRNNLEPHLAPHRWQHQPHDHVLRDTERRHSVFGATCAYIADNPARAGLVHDASGWPYTGSIVPGYPDLNPTAANFWDIFWRIYNEAVERGRIGKMSSRSQA